MLARKRLADLITVDELSTSQDASSPNPEAGLIAKERSEALEVALAGLSNRDQLLLTLRFGDGATARQIAALMGFPSQALVYRELNKTLRQLRMALQERGIERPGA
jgi:RNA polymerase sigma factor (sigma-70 family)